MSSRRRGHGPAWKRRQRKRAEARQGAVLPDAPKGESVWVEFCKCTGKQRYRGNGLECPRCGFPPAKVPDPDDRDRVLGGSVMPRTWVREVDAGADYRDPYDDACSARKLIDRRAKKK
jgi:hypothetical protein